MTVVLGIDPGCSGALVLVTEQGGYIDHLAMPTIKVGTKSRTAPRWRHGSGSTG